METHENNNKNLLNQLLSIERQCYAQLLKRRCFQGLAIKQKAPIELLSFSQLVNGAVGYRQKPYDKSYKRFETISG